MCKMAGCIFIVNLLLDKSVLNVVTDQLAGEYDLADGSGEHAFYESRYGDFETLVTSRRREDMFNHLPRARANIENFFEPNEIADWFDSTSTNLECMKGTDGSTDMTVNKDYRDKGAMRLLCESQASVTALMD